jgi:hypothetical protein
VNGLAGSFADDVPQRDVDAADRRNGHAAQAVVLDLVIQLLPQHFDVERVASDQRGPQQRFDNGSVDGRWPVAIAPADDAVVGADLDDQRALGLIDPAPGRSERLVNIDEQLMGDNFCNLHGWVFERYWLTDG